ncbi:MAG: hypothetical protein CO189_00130 [candidate division Zixibacteria bacterium CG_4_9_14_3_um_filter_46_8]|nr:MAG: hypothetical protein CO189_00130 [candidate division Zixibacteria bacterium CG_4_9_14_3_um_filter_46_8]
MITKHLADEDIQLYLDGISTTRDDFIRRHLLTCQHCQEELASYQQLYKELKDDFGYGLSAGFSERVSSKIPVSCRSSLVSQYSEIILSLFGVILGGFLAFYIIGAESVIKIFSNLNPIGFFSTDTTLNSLRFFSSILRADFHLILLAGLILIFIIAFDKIISVFRYN